MNILLVKSTNAVLFFNATETFSEFNPVEFKEYTPKIKTIPNVPNIILKAIFPTLFFQIISIVEAGNQPTFPSSKRISFHSRIVSSLISTL